ncbi:putative mitochondrial protein [Vitis vinifera]|uniref:Putative mitochondrial protein n=1 Tax=Vitis vinifera TaxID=29760 RepID=A0A438FG77_VITVI|nr:putative mitochondrial protein [Vitis vinifera]
MKNFASCNTNQNTKASCVNPIGTPTTIVAKISIVTVSTNDHNTVITTKTPTDVALGASGHNSNIATTTGTLSQIKSTSSYKLANVNNFPDIITLGWTMRQLNVKNAFLHGFLKEEVFMEQPPGFINEDLPNHVCKLNLSLCGLKQAPRAWQLVGSLQYLTFTRPGIVHAVNKACQHFQAPTKVDLRVVKHILRYLKGTMGHGVKFFKKSLLRLISFYDADWARCTNTKRSSSRILAFNYVNLLNCYAITSMPFT